MGVPRAAPVELAPACAVARATLRIRREAAAPACVDLVPVLRTPLARPAHMAGSAPRVETGLQTRVRPEHRRLAPLPTPCACAAEPARGASGHRRDPRRAQRAWRLRGRPRPVWASARPHLSQLCARPAVGRSTARARSSSEASPIRSTSTAPSPASTRMRSPTFTRRSQTASPARSIRLTLSRDTPAATASFACVMPRARRTMRIAAARPISRAMAESPGNVSLTRGEESGRRRRGVSGDFRRGLVIEEYAAIWVRPRGKRGRATPHARRRAAEEG